jgi:hypothetical protein
MSTNDKPSEDKVDSQTASSVNIPLSRDWKERSQILGDVVFFRYSKAENEKTFDEVFVWDLDKTYLDSSWGSVRELWRTAIEKAFQKRNIPGTGSLVSALKNSWEEERPSRAFPIYFITASPPQMESRIREKLELDEILPLGSFYKDNLKNLKPSRLWRLRQQVGFKLQALLQLRARVKDNVRQVLWGDDSESDAIIYSLYSDICARRWEEKDLLDILRGLHVIGEQTDTILDLQDRIPTGDPVEKIYINLATDTDPEYYLKFGRRVVATYNTFQAALDLLQDGRLNPEQVIRVAEDMVMNFGFTKEELDSSFDNLVRRQILGSECVADTLELFKSRGLFSREFRPTIEPRPVAQRVGKRVYALDGVHEPWLPEHIDYLHDFR